MNAKVKSLFLAITLILVFAFGYDGNEPPDICIPNPRGQLLIVQLREQGQTNWCWAACGQMVMEKLGKFVSQCEQAENRFHPNGVNCCSSGSSPKCNKGAFPEFEKYGFLSDQTHNAPLSWDQIKNEIGCTRAPFCASWKDGGSGHMVVVTGYKLRDGEKAVRIIDPAEDTGPRFFSYDYYKVPYGYEEHWNDYYNIRAE